MAGEQFRIGTFRHQLIACRDRFFLLSLENNSRTQSDDRFSASKKIQKICLQLGNMVFKKTRF
ncbi:MAG: hypothetical protein EAZ42_03015 [Verrucomicrobia bacterium]|nr:MAG: hypothetical protein EAZ42_03015 [Verrucomicrobiota bacterium]